MKRKRLPPKPSPPADGIFILDPATHKEVFVPFDALHNMCKIAVAQSSQPSYRRDPTYDLKKQRKRL